MVTGAMTSSVKIRKVFFLHDQLFSIVYDIIIYFYRSFYLYKVKKKAKKVSSLKTFVSKVQVENHGWIRPDHN